MAKNKLQDLIDMKQFQSVFELAPNGILIMGTDGKFIKVNKSFCEMLGYSETELTSMTFRDITYSEDLSASNEWGNQLLNNEMTRFDFEKRYVHKSGQVVWGIVRALLKRDSDGLPLYFITHVQDITQCKLAENKLKELSARNEVILATVPDIIMQVDNDKVYTWANKAGYEFFGEDVIGNNAEQYFEGEQETYYIVNPLFNGSSDNIYVESFQRRKDGKKRLLAWYCHVLKDSAGNVYGALSSARDVTEEREAQEKLRNSQAMYQDLVETAQDLIWQCDKEGRYIYLNPAWEEVFGYKIEEMLGKKFTDFQTKEWAERDLKEFSGLLKGNTIKGLETVHIGKDGKEINLIFNAKYVRDEKGGIIGTRGTAFDISSFKKVEKALIESEERYRLVLENSLDAILLTAPDGSIYSANPAACRMLQRTEEEICALGRKGLLDLDDPRLPQLLEERKLTGKAKGELLMVRKDGTKFSVEISTSVFTEKHGQLRTSMIIRDITERKKAEEKIQKQLEELKRYNTTMIDREIRMIQLKQEINSYCNKLHLPDKYSIPDNFTYTEGGN